MARRRSSGRSRPYRPQGGATPSRRPGRAQHQAAPTRGGLERLRSLLEMRMRRAVGNPLPPRERVIHGPRKGKAVGNLRPSKPQVIHGPPAPSVARRVLNRLKPRPSEPVPTLIGTGLTDTIPPCKARKARRRAVFSTPGGPGKGARSPRTITPTTKVRC